MDVRQFRAEIGIEGGASSPIGFSGSVVSIDVSLGADPGFVTLIIDVH